MTRIMFGLAALFFAVMIGGFVAGIAGAAPGLLALALFVAGPLFTFCLAFGMGRASNEFVITRRDRVTVTAQQVNGRRQPQPRVDREVLG